MQLQATNTMPEYIFPSLTKLDAYRRMVNIATTLKDDVITNIQATVAKDYDIDKLTRKPWEERNAKAMKLATQIIEAKNTPWPNAANVKYPLLTVGCIQFSARAYPQIIQGKDVVKTKVTGIDPAGVKAARASRISEHMSYQLTEEMEDWTEEMDNLLIALPMEGCEFKKTFFDPILSQNVSQLVRPKDLVVNYFARSLERAPRATHHVWLYPNEIVERIRKKVFIEFDFGMPTTHQESEMTEAQEPSDDEDAPHLFLEQHRWWDLDGDGYKEPYVCTVHKDTGKLVRMVARWDMENVEVNEDGKIAKITPSQYFTRFLFMPSPDGGFYGMGFDVLLYPINSTVNSIINQLLDAGHRQNTGGGFIGAGISLSRRGMSGPVRFKPGEYKKVNFHGDDIRKNIVELNMPEPSRVLFLLLGTMIEAGKEISSISEVMTGQQPAGNLPVGTIHALIEQGLKVFSGIFTRVHRSLKCEYRKIHRLNRLYLDDDIYFTVLDSPKAVKRTDYDDTDLDVQPVSNPNEVSDVQKIMKASALRELLGTGLNDQVIQRRYLEALGIPDVEELMPDPNAKPPIDPKTMLEIQKLELERDKFELSLAETGAKIVKLRADALNAIARAEAAEQGPQLEIYKAELAALEKLTGNILNRNARQETQKGEMP